MATKKSFVVKNGLDASANAISNLGVSSASLTLSGAFAVTLTSTGATNVTLPTSGTLLTSGGALGTPASGNLANCTFPTLNQNTSGSSASCTGNAATVTNGFYTTSSFYLGTTSIAVNRASGSLSLTGINIDGNAATASIATTCSGTAAIATKVSLPDYRSTSLTPSYFGPGINAAFMSNATDSLSDGGSYHGVIQLQQWSDASGGGAHQLGFTDNNNIWHRGSSGGVTSWASWYKLIDTNNYGSSITSLTAITNISTGAAATAGTITGDWSLGSGSKLRATYADLAENYVSDQSYDYGIVLMIGGDEEVTIATEETQKLAGVVSKNPAYLMNSECEGKHVVAIALQGRTPVRVMGKVNKGDFLVSAGNGYAKATDNPRIGSIIGKSLESFDGQYGMVEAMVGRL
jgi:hypothetical protein